MGTLAGVVVFVYVIGALTVVVRLDRLQLSGEVVIPEIPRERLALLGLAQILWTLVLGGLIAVARAASTSTTSSATCTAGP